MSDDRPLLGRRVLVTRAPTEWLALRARLEALGADPEFRPTIRQVAPPDTSAVAESLDALDRYAWIVFTSPAGVRFFHDAADRRGIAPERMRARIGAVGPGTARAIAERGYRADVVAPSAHGRALASALSERVAAGDRVLWVRPVDAASDLKGPLSERGAIVDGVVFYATVPSEEVGVVLAGILSARYDAVLWTSPSSLRSVLDAAGTARADAVAAIRSARAIALGPTTAAALERAGIAPVAVADDPSEEELAGLFRRVLAR